MSRTRKYIRPYLYPEQEAALFAKERYSWIEASTKSGKTVGALAWIYEDALLRGWINRHWWWIAPVYSQADIAFRRLGKMMPPGSFYQNKVDHYYQLPSGAYIWFKTAEKPDNLYGEDVYGAVFDEASRAREEAWFAVRSTLTATRGPVRLIGNVKGRRNWFWQGCRRAEQGFPNHKHFRITADDAVAAGVLDPQEIDDARATYPEHIFRELYYAEASEDGSNPFGESNILACVGEQSMDQAVAFGVDVAKQVDNTAIIGLNEKNNVCFFKKFRKSWGETLHIIGNFVGDRPALVDSTGPGDSIVEQLQRQYGTNFQGFKFTNISKQNIMERLAVAIQTQNIQYPAGDIVDELMTFEYDVNERGVTRYTAMEGFFDDCVMALALALQCKSEANWEWDVV